MNAPAFVKALKSWHTTSMFLLRRFLVLCLRTRMLRLRLRLRLRLQFWLRLRLLLLSSSHPLIEESLPQRKNHWRHNGSGMLAVRVGRNQTDSAGLKKTQWLRDGSRKVCKYVNSQEMEARLCVPTVFNDHFSRGS